MTRIVRDSTNPTQVRLKTPMETYQTEWNLTTKEKSHLTMHALRNWSLSELSQALSVTGTDELFVRLWDVVYLASIKSRPTIKSLLLYLAHKERDWREPLDSTNDKHPTFWLSFRAGVWEGQQFAFVVVQEDKKGRE